MKRSEISLKNMLDIVATYIVLHKLCIVNNEGIKEDQIADAENKLAIRITQIQNCDNETNYVEREWSLLSEKKDFDQ